MVRILYIWYHTKEHKLYTKRNLTYKMKKSLILFAIILVSIISNKSFAQTTQTANVNISLANVLQLTVGSASIDMAFDSEAKYTNGITTTSADQLVVIASRGFQVTAKAGTITGDVTADAVKITTAIGSGNAGSTTGKTFVTDLVLPATAATAQPVVTSTSSSWNGATSANKFNVTYKVGAGGQFAGKTTGSYVIPVVYTVINP